MSRIVSVRAEPARYPLKSPFESARRRSTVAENVRVEVRLASGVTGYGEGSPAAYVTGEIPESVLAGVRRAGAALEGLEAARVRPWADRLRQVLPDEPTARSALEMALLDALARAWEISLATYFGGALTELRTDLTLPIGEPQSVAALAAEAASAGFRTLKIKVGSPDREADLERVRRVADAASGCRIRLDANQGFTAETALAFLDACLSAGVPVELMEQPVPRDDWAGLAAVTARSPVPVIADEAVTDAAAALRLAATGAAHGINIKIAKCGFFGALQIVAIAQAAGLKLMIGCMLESLLGIGASLHFACGTGAFDYVDLDSHMLIGLTPTGRPFLQEGELLRLDPTATGIGWSP